MLNFLVIFRFAYHGVPAIIPHNLQNNWIGNEDSLLNDDSTIKPIEKSSNPLVCCDICKTESFQCNEKKCSKRCQKSKNNDVEEIGKFQFDTKDNDKKLSIHNTDNDISSKDFNTEDSNICLNDPVFQYLKQGRININVRRVVKPNSAWMDKHGSGASYT